MSEASQRRRKSSLPSLGLDVSRRRVSYDEKGGHQIHQRRKSHSALNQEDAHNEETFIYSQQSIISAMDRFVTSINNMGNSILIPSRLKDMETPKGSGPKAVEGADLYSVFQMLNGLKKDFMYGAEGEEIEEEDYSHTCGIKINNGHQGSVANGSRRCSKENLSCCESGYEDSASTDSGDGTAASDASNTIENKSEFLANELKTHLRGIYDILHQLSDTADFITTKYHDDIEGENGTSDSSAASELLRYRKK